jgi:hypothetical protein
MRKAKQKGTIIRIGERWYVRYWERRNVGGVIERKRVSHCLGPATTRGKHPPADIKDTAAEHLAIVNRGAIPADRITTVGQFVDGVYLPWIKQHKRPSTQKSYRDIWEDHLQSECADAWMKNVRTFQVQGWLNSIGAKGLGRNSLKHLKSALSAIFKLGKQQGYFDGVNPVQDSAINPSAPAPEETCAYSLEEVNAILAHIPEPAATAFAIAACAGRRVGEIEALHWEDYRDGEIHVSRSRWNGHETEPKTKKSRAPVPHRALCWIAGAQQQKNAADDEQPVRPSDSSVPQSLRDMSEGRSGSCERGTRIQARCFPSRVAWLARCKARPGDQPESVGCG